MNLIGKVVHRGEKCSQFNQHKYVAIAYDNNTGMYLVVNFTTKRGTRTPSLTIEVKKEEFPSILTEDISVVVYSKAEELTAEEFVSCGIKQDSYGKDIVCPDALLKRVIAQIDAGSSLDDKYIRRYFPNSPILNQ